MKHVQIPESAIGRIEALAESEGLTFEGATDWIVHAGLDFLEKAMADLAWLEGEELAEPGEK
jgi:hypothetical protein